MEEPGHPEMSWKPLCEADRQVSIWAICLTPQNPLGLLPNSQLWVSALGDTQGNQPPQFPQDYLSFSTDSLVPLHTSVPALRRLPSPSELSSSSVK